MLKGSVTEPKKKMKEYEDGESMCKQIITSICTALICQNKTNKYIYIFSIILF